MVGLFCLEGFPLCHPERSEGSSSTSMAAIQGEEDASCLSMTKGKGPFFPPLAQVL
ncbi:hypothetical protein MTO98_00245 [Mucilaginibacter sp. SMC90]|uniref:hypothetical protein n=1 Tax=Mucilaginibacter sp. SMC90 TaxID=2929803 RepID=UPI001FB2A2AA|nr:hypothetical protein [Mucilaginibacter sp. SMC90]UOE49500.1 hypothetical protein MTO98_00245 [Mucilaginibacter sp. SMC90]